MNIRSSRLLLLSQALLLCGPAVWNLAKAAALECTAAQAHPQWPIFHPFNSLDHGEMGHLNDANAIFEYRGIYHLMMQAGGGNWTHFVSNDLVHWHHLRDALDSGGPNITFPDRGPCDGSVSFPNLGAPPYDGSTPVILYDADCGTPLP